MEASGLVPKVAPLAGILARLPQTQVPLKEPHISGVDGGIFWEADPAGRSGRPAEQQMFNYSALPAEPRPRPAPAFVRRPALRVSVSSSHSAASV